MANDPRLDIFLDDSREVFTSIEQGQHIWQADPFDVETLNAPARRVFKRLLDRASSDSPPGAGKLLLLLGESGSGKTHLVRAFRNTAHGQRKGFVGYMPMTVDVAHYDRYILSNLIDSLDKPFDEAGDDDDSGLMHLSDALMAQCNSAYALHLKDEQILEGDALHDTIRFVADELLMDPRFQNVEVDLLRALIYLHRRDPRLNRRVFHWLRCESLSEADQAVIGNLIPRTADDAPARMVEHLGRLMGGLGQALVLCVDQVEDVSDFEHRPQMENSFRRAMNSLTAIASKVPRSVVVFCCLSDYWAKMKPLLNQSTVDRIENDPEPVLLERHVTAGTARDLAARRLRSLFEQRGATASPSDPTWPIPASSFDVLGGHRARHVLDECRRYRDRAIQDGKLPSTFPLPRPEDQGQVAAEVAPVLQQVSPDMDQLWTNFRAGVQIDPPEEPAKIVALLAWAIETGSKELGDAKRFDVKPEHKEMLDIQVHPDGRKLFIALCEKESRGGSLGRQMTEALKKAAGKTPVLIRTSDFPPAKPGSVIAEQLGELLRQGGRRVIVGDSELRDLEALRMFREKHAGEAALAEWSRTARPITRLKSVGDILGLEKPDTTPPSSGPKSPNTSANKGGDTLPMSNVGARSTATKGQTELFTGPPPVHSGPPASSEVHSGAKSSPSARAETSAREARNVHAHREPAVSQDHKQGRAELLADDPLEGITVESTILPGSPIPPQTATKARIGFKVNEPSVESAPAPRPVETLTGPLRIGASEGVFSQVVTVDPSELTRHSAFLGTTGSGKTTLALNVLEQLLLRGIPAILVDRKGDLAAYARDLSWEEHLDDPTLIERRRLLRERVEVALYTPGRSDGRPLAIPVVPRGLESQSMEEREQGVQQAADAIAGMLEYRTSPNDKAARALLTQALRLLVQRPPGSELTLEMVQKFVAEQDESLRQETGGLPAKTFAKLAQDLEVLRLDLRPLMATGGERLDMNELLGLGAASKPGKTRLSIISTKYLGDLNRVRFWVSQLLLEANRWTSQHPASKLQAVILFDEADIYLPATSKPATKQPMENLLKRARSAGLGVMLGTQSPGDLDYKCRENVRTWFVGGVKEDNALKKLRPMFTEARVDAEAKLPGQKIGQFHVLRDGKVQQLRADRAVIRTEQLSEDEILKEARRTRERSDK